MCHFVLLVKRVLFLDLFTLVDRFSVFKFYISSECEIFKFSLFSFFIVIFINKYIVYINKQKLTMKPNVSVPV